MRTIAKTVYVICPNCETPIEAEAYDWTAEESDFRSSCRCGEVVYFRRYYDGTTPRNDPPTVRLCTLDTFEAYWKDEEDRLSFV